MLDTTSQPVKPHAAALEKHQVHIGIDVLTDQLIESLHLHLYQNIIILTDKTVETLYAITLQQRLHANHYTSHLLCVEPGEKSKTRETKYNIENQLLELHCGRDTIILAMGGGVVTDLAGYIAATYCRGIPCVYFPTTLLAMIDAALGGKTGVNTRHGKNLIGTFTYPTAIISDITTLNTLARTEYVYAFAEVIKHALVADKDHFKYLLENAHALIQRDPSTLSQTIQRNCQIKLSIVDQDKEEKGIREILNFGHTIGHAIEHASEYQIPHGQAVATGMIIESFIAQQSGLLSHTDAEKIQDIIDTFNIPLAKHPNITQANIQQSLLRDKKTRQHQPRFVLLESIGRVKIKAGRYAHSIDPRILEQAIEYLVGVSR